MNPLQFDDYSKNTTPAAVQEGGKKKGKMSKSKMIIEDMSKGSIKSLMKRLRAGMKMQNTLKNTGGKRKGNKWTQLVTKTYKVNHKKNKDYTFKQAIKDAKKVYKKGGDLTNSNSNSNENENENENEGGENNKYENENEGGENNKYENENELEMKEHMEGGENNKYENENELEMEGGIADYKLNMKGGKKHKKGKKGTRKCK